MNTPPRLLTLYWITFFLVGAMGLTACSGDTDKAFETSSSALDAPQGSANNNAPMVDVSLASNTTRAGGNQASQDRLIIQNARLELVVEDPARTLNAFRTWATDTWGGWVVNSNLLGSGESRHANLTIRIPAQRFNEALDQLKAEAQEVTSESIEGRDVTEAYTDLASQLRNLAAAETELQRIMEAADTTQDILAVYDQLTTIRGRIEAIQGQMQYYEQSAAFASITITLRQVVEEEPDEDKKVWRPLETAKSAVNALLLILQMVGDFAIVIIIIGLPLALLFGVPTWWMRRFWSKRRSKA